MSLLVNKTLKLQGEATPPGSKSESIRAIIMATLAQGKSTLTNILHSEDTQDAIKVCRHLGANISESSNILTVHGHGLPLQTTSEIIHSGNSGVTTHFVMPLLGLRKNPQQSIILNCSEQMLKRPITPLVDALRCLGLQIEYLEQKNRLPIRVTGELTGGIAEVEGIMSQYLSALLFALPCAKGDSELIVKNLQERPYVDMTLSYLKAQGIEYQHIALSDIDIYKIIGRQGYKTIHKQIPGDFSSASCLIAASALLPGEVTLSGLNMHEAQGDKQLVAILQKMGADISIEPTCLVIRGGKPLSGVTIDAGDIPDLLPILAVLGTRAAGKTEINNVASARIKETDRIHSMTDGLTRMGAMVIEKENGLTLFQSHLVGHSVKGYGDHRTVMALSIAGMLAEGTTIIDDHEAINKTFPNFINVMRSLGAEMEVANEIIA